MVRGAKTLSVSEENVYFPKLQGEEHFLQSLNPLDPKGKAEITPKFDIKQTTNALPLSRNIITRHNLT